MNGLEFFLINLNTKFFLENRKAKGGNKTDKWLRCTTLLQTILSNLSFADANLSNADFTGTKFQHTNFTRANLYQAKFSQCFFKNNVSLIDANLQEADLSWSYLDCGNVDFKETYTIESYHLKGVNFANANLEGIVIGGCLSKGKNLDQVNLTNAKLRYGFYEDYEGNKKKITIKWLINQGAEWDYNSPPSFYSV